MNKLDEFFVEADKFTISVNDLIDFADGKKFEFIEEYGCAFINGVFVAYSWSRDIEIFKKLRNIGCSNIGVIELDKDRNKTNDSKLVALISNEDFYGTVTIKTLENEDEYIDYICKYEI